MKHLPGPLFWVCGLAINLVCGFTGSTHLVCCFNFFSAGMCVVMMPFTKFINDIDEIVKRYEEE